jgi:betaine/carnitine transporter, BCCT family
MFSAMRGWLTSNLDWFFISAGNVFVLVCLGLAISPLGRVRLGGTEATPDYSYLGWFSMLFAAGMGIGLMFYGVSEPLSHFRQCHGGHQRRGRCAHRLGAAGRGRGRCRGGAATGHGGHHLPLGLAPLGHLRHPGPGPGAVLVQQGLPLTIRSVFYPLLGERVWGWPGHVIDILAVLATCSVWLLRWGWVPRRPQPV